MEKNEKTLSSFWILLTGFFVWWILNKVLNDVLVSQKDDIDWLMNTGLWDLFPTGGFFNTSDMQGTKTNFTTGVLEALQESKFSGSEFIKQQKTAQNIANTFKTLASTGYLDWCSGSFNTIPEYIKLPFLESVGYNSTAPFLESYCDVGLLVGSTYQTDNASLSQLYSSLFQPAAEVAKNVVNSSDYESRFERLLNNFTSTEFQNASEQFFDALTDCAVAMDSGKSSIESMFCGNEFVMPFVGYDPDRYYQEETAFGEVCTELLDKLRLSEGETWLKYNKPFFTGKIYYSPKNAKTDQIMAFVQKFFTELNKTITDSRTFLESYDKTFDDMEKIIGMVEPFANFFAPNGKGYSLLSNKDKSNWKTLMESTKSILERLVYLASCFVASRVYGFESEDKMVSTAASKELREGLVWAGVVFDNVDADSIPKVVKYTLRMSSDLVDDTNRLYQMPWNYTPSTQLDDLRHMATGQDYLMDLIEKAVIQVQTGAAYEKIGVLAQQFPSPTYFYSERSYKSVAYLFLSLITVIVLSNFMTVSLLVHNIVYEKETGIKFYLYFFNVYTGIRWTAWFISSLLYLLLFMAIPIFLACFILPKSSVSLIMFVFFSYLLATIAFCMAASTCFYYAKLAGIVTAFIFAFSYIPAFPLAYCPFTVLKVLASLVSHNVTMGLICFYFAAWEYYEVGANWSNAGHSPVYPDSFALGYGLLLLYINTLLYILMAMFLNKAYPGPYFVSPGVLALIRNSCCRKKRDSSDVHSSPKKSVAAQTTRVAPADGQVIRLNGVHVKYPSATSKEEIESPFYSFHCVQNQTTCVLGTARSWKTSVLLAICGLRETSQGEIYMNGELMNKKTVCCTAGFAPQFIPLWFHFTVKRNLWFYGSLHGMSRAQIEQRSAKALTELKCEDKSACRVKELTFEDKRKVTLVLAVLNDSPIAIFDEPSHGMTLKAERQVWSFMFTIKNRSILFSTKNCNEANLLSEKMVVVSPDGMHCIGSPQFVRKNLNSDPVVILYRKYAANVGIANELYLSRIDRFMADAFRDSKLVREEDMEIVYRLSKESAHGRNLAFLLDRLTSFREILLLEEFLLINYSAPDMSVLGSKAVMEPSLNQRFDMLDVNKTNTPDLTKSKLHAAQMGGVIVKDFYSTLTCAALVILVLFPIFLMTIAVIVFCLTEWGPGRQGSLPALELDPWEYGHNQLILYADLTTLGDPIMDELREGLLNNPYFSTGCVKHDVDSSAQFDCDDDDATQSFQAVSRRHVSLEDVEKMTEHIRNTRTSGGEPVCVFDDGPPPDCKEPTKEPKEMILSSGDTLLDVSDFDISDYVLRTRMNDRFDKILGFVVFDDSSSPYGYDAKLSMEALQFFSGLFKNASYLSRSAMGWPDSFMRRSDWDRSVSKGVVLWWDNKARYMLPAAVNSINNVIYRALMANLDPDNYKKYAIIAVAYPWNPYYYEDERDLLIYPRLIILITFICGIFSIVPAYLFYLLVWENVSGCKHLQFISGLNMFVYWVSTYIFHLCALMIPATICIVALFFITDPTFFPMDLLLYFMYALAVFPYIYMFIPLFTSPGAAMMVMTTVLHVQGLCLCALSMYMDANYPSVASYLKPIFMLSPPYCLCGGLIETVYVKYKQDRYAEDISLLSMQAVGLFVLMLFLDAVLYVLAVLIIEYRPKLKQQKVRRSVGQLLGLGARDLIDNDMASESVMSTISVKRMNKVYGHPKLKCKCGRKKKSELVPVNHAIKDVTFSVPAWTCLCLYGDTDSGKTTIVNILSGKTNVTSGSVYITGIEFVKFYKQNKNRKMVGFCPENDNALHNDLTLEQELVFYATIRGIRRDNVKKVLNWLYIALDMKEFKHRAISKLSLDEKRKISVAIALIGNAKILILDEPFTNLSPNAKFLLQQALMDQIKSAKALLITSRVTENSGNGQKKTLIDSFMILTDKGVRFRGNRRHMLESEGNFFLATVYLEDKQNTSEFVEKFSKTFPTSTLLEQFPKYAVFKIPKGGNLNFYQMFERLTPSGASRKRSKDDLPGVVNFYLSDPTINDLSKYALVPNYVCAFDEPKDTANVEVDKDKSRTKPEDKDDRDSKARKSVRRRKTTSISGYLDVDDGAQTRSNMSSNSGLASKVKTVPQDESFSKNNEESEKRNEESEKRDEVKELEKKPEQRNASEMSQKRNSELEVPAATTDARSSSRSGRRRVRRSTVGTKKNEDTKQSIYASKSKTSEKEKAKEPKSEKKNSEGKRNQDKRPSGTNSQQTASRMVVAPAGAGLPVDDNKETTQPQPEKRMSKPTVASGSTDTESVPGSNY